MHFDIYGTGALGRALRARGAACDNVHFHGFHADMPAALAAADLLLHTCPTEPFGLVVLEAMASGLPVLVPDTGGAGDLVIPGLTGLHYRAGNAEDLAARLLAVDHMLPWSLNAMVHQARLDLVHRFGRVRRLDDYRRLLLTEVSAP